MEAVSEGDVRYLPSMLLKLQRAHRYLPVYVAFAAQGLGVTAQRQVNMPCYLCSANASGFSVDFVGKPMETMDMATLQHLQSFFV